MARSELVDVLAKFLWKIKIDDFSRAGFTSCQTPSFNISTYNYPEGGAHMNPRQIMDKISYTPITLYRGVTADTSFNQWATGIFDVQQASRGAQIAGDIESSLGFNPADSLGPELGNALSGVIKNSGLVGPTPVPSYQSLGGTQKKNYRKDISIQHVNKTGQLVVEYKLYGAWPIAYKPASDFDATDDEGFSIESITLAYDGFDVRYGSLGASAASALL